MLISQFNNLGEMVGFHKSGHKYLCTFATSVPSERIFSRSGYVANALRSRLRPDMLDKLVFLCSNRILCID